MKKINISVVIPNWNGEQLLKENLPSIIEAKRKSVNRIGEIVVVDDGSSDDSVEFLEKNFAKEIRLIKHKQNRGFAAAVNMGVGMSKGELVCLLNTDVRVSEKFLEHVWQHFRDEKVVAVGLHEKGYGPAVGLFERGFIGYMGGEESDGVEPSFWANGGSSVYRKSVWKKLKGLDEKLFSPFYWEDVDLGYRAWKRGYTILWEPRARVLHEHEAVINESNFRRRRMNVIKERNQLLFIWKNLTSKRLFRKHLRGLLRRLVRHPGYMVVVLVALKKLKVVRRLRKIEKKESRVSDEAVLAKFQ